MKRSTSHILTTHTGSLPRSRELQELLRQREERRPVDQAVFAEGVRTAVADVVQRQIAMGMDVINDGEQERSQYAAYVKERLSGFEGERVIRARPRLGDTDFPEYVATHQSSTSLPQPACTGPIAWKDKDAVQRDIATLKAAIGTHQVEEVFMTAASPGVIANFLPNEYYPTEEAYLYALAEAMKHEYQAIVQAGFLLQIDCPDLAMTRVTQFADLTVHQFKDVVALHIDVLNAALADLPPERMRLHLCWGNYEGPHHHDVPLQEIIHLVLKARPVGLSFEGANPRHAHEWKVWREVQLPDDKVIIPGVLDSTTNFIEHPELVAERIARYAEVVGRERVIASTDCGFGTSAWGRKVDGQIAWAKLQAMVEGSPGLCGTVVNVGGWRSVPYRRMYEINTRVWLAELVASRAMPEATLAAIPESYIDLWRRWQIDAVWLMGVWEPSLYSARVVRENTASVVSLQPALDDFSLDDCVSSPYAVRSYTVAEQLGGLEGLLQLRARLHQAGIGLILDFVPNHTACDHPWIHEHPQYYVQGSLAEATRAPSDFFPVQTAQGLRYIAHGKDPYFPSWCDTAQLNYSNLELHDAMQDQLLRLAQWCDGVRCDMAMLCLSDVFARTWSRLDLPIPPREFWQEALQAVRTHFPNFCCTAEVYWGLQARLQQLGFHLTYDKEFYDALLARDVDRLAASIRTPHAPLEANVRFLENHDETRAAVCFSDDQQEAALLAIATLPGALLLHEGQTEGYRVRTPVQLRRRRQEPGNPRLQSLYERFLTLPDIRQGHFAVLQPHAAATGDDTYKTLLAWAWIHESHCWLVVINYADRLSQGFINLAELPLPSGVLRFRDHLHHSTYEHSRETVQHTGFPVVLPPFGAQLLEVTLQV